MHIICNFEALHKIFIPCLDVAATFAITFLFLLIINQTWSGDCFFCSLGKNICNKTISVQSPSDSSPAHQTPNCEENSHIKCTRYYSLEVFKVSFRPTTWLWLCINCKTLSEWCSWQIWHHNSLSVLFWIMQFSCWRLPAAQSSAILPVFPQRYTDTGSNLSGEGCDDVPLKTNLLALLNKVGIVKPSCRTVILILILPALTAQTQPFHLIL